MNEFRTPAIMVFVFGLSLAQSLFKIDVPWFVWAGGLAAIFLVGEFLPKKSSAAAREDVLEGPGNVVSADSGPAAGPDAGGVLSEPALGEGPGALLPAQAQVAKATIPRRLGAFVADLTILGVTETTALTLLARLTQSLDASIQATLLLVVGAAAAAFYHVWPYSSTGQTPGKKLLDLRVEAIDGSPLSWRKGLLRWIGGLPSLVPGGLGYLWALWDRDGQTWCDKLAGTVVLSGTGQGLMVPADVARRRQRRWLIGLGVPALLLVLLAAAPAVVVGKWSLEEYTARADAVRWVEASESTEEAVSLDMSSLGLRLVEVRSAQAEAIPGSYAEGAVAKYEREGRPTVVLFALKWSGSESMRSGVGIGRPDQPLLLEKVILDQFCVQAECEWALALGPTSMVMLMSYGPPSIEVLGLLGHVPSATPAR